MVRSSFGSSARRLPANSIAYIAMSIDAFIAWSGSTAAMSGSWPLVLPLGQLVDEAPVLLGQPHQLADHLRRQLRGDLVDELDVALLAGRRP